MNVTITREVEIEIDKDDIEEFCKECHKPDDCELCNRKECDDFLNELENELIHRSFVRKTNNPEASKALDEVIEMIKTGRIIKEIGSR